MICVCLYVSCAHVYMLWPTIPIPGPHPDYRISDMEPENLHCNNSKFSGGFSWVQILRTISLGDRLGCLHSSCVLSFYPDFRPGLRVWRELLTTQEPHRATMAHPAGPLPCCVTSRQSLALSGPYSPTLSISEPLVVLAVWTFGLTVTIHVWYQEVFATEKGSI